MFVRQPYLKNGCRLSLVIGSLLLLLGCDGSDFMGSGKGKNIGMSGGGGPVATPTDVPVNYNEGERKLGGNDDMRVAGDLVPLNVYYEGKTSKADALFTFHVRRTSPRVDGDTVEAISSVRREFITRSLPNFCTCGQRNEMEFYWIHTYGRGGALHTNHEGEWLVAHEVSHGPWMTADLKQVPTGLHTLFLGADTQNPAFLNRPEGDGYLRSINFAPNALFGNQKTWANRSTMRLAFSCAVDRCPAETRNNTTLFFAHHPTMVPNE